MMHLLPNHELGYWRSERDKLVLQQDELWAKQNALWSQQSELRIEQYKSKDEIWQKELQLSARSIVYGFDELNLMAPNSDSSVLIEPIELELINNKISKIRNKISTIKLDGIGDANKKSILESILRKITQSLNNIDAQGKKASDLDDLAIYKVAVGVVEKSISDSVGFSNSHILPVLQDIEHLLVNKGDFSVLDRLSRFRLCNDPVIPAETARNALASPSNLRSTLKLAVKPKVASGFVKICWNIAEALCDIGCFCLRHLVGIVKPNPVTVKFQKIRELEKTRELEIVGIPSSNTGLKRAMGTLNTDLKGAMGTFKNTIFLQFVDNETKKKHWEISKKKLVLNKRKAALDQAGDELMRKRTELLDRAIQESKEDQPLLSPNAEPWLSSQVRREMIGIARLKALCYFQPTDKPVIDQLDDAIREGRVAEIWKHIKESVIQETMSRMPEERIDPQKIDPKTLLFIGNFSSFWRREEQPESRNSSPTPFFEQSRQPGNILPDGLVQQPPTTEIESHVLAYSASTLVTV